MMHAIIAFSTLAAHLLAPASDLSPQPQLAQAASGWPTAAAPEAPPADSTVTGPWVGFERLPGEGKATDVSPDSTRPRPSRRVRLFGQGDGWPRLELRLLGDGGTAELTLHTGNRGGRYRVEASTDWLEWVDLAVVEAAGTPVRIEDPEARDLPMRFYRALLVPTLAATFFNGPPVYTLGLEDAANPSCGCRGDTVYTQGVAPAAESCAECRQGGPGYTGLAQDTGRGSVLLHTGELVHRAVDLEIKGRGLSFRFERRYRSGILFAGPLGHNWDHSHNRRLYLEPDGDVLRLDGLGRADRYTLVDGDYRAPRSYYTRLLRHPDGSFLERDRHGAKAAYSAPDARGIARLTALTDRVGNRLEFRYSADGHLAEAIDPFGRTIVYHHDATGRLTSLEDFTGRRLRFEYDAQGDLVAATGPAVTGTPHGNDFPNGQTTRYRYSRGFTDPRLNHGLLEIVAPNEVFRDGPPRLKVEYVTELGSANAGRVRSLTLGGTNTSRVPAGGTIVYSFRALGTAAAGDLQTPVAETTVLDRNGNRAEYQFNSLGNIARVREFTNRNLRPAEPDFFETQYDYNAEGEIARVRHPEGNSIEYTYDHANPDRFQQGNLLRATRWPDATRGGDQTRIDTTYTYEPLFNQVRTATDPRGHDPTYRPPQGGVRSPERYTTSTTFDYQEAATPPAEALQWGIAIPPALLGLGDLNGDGRTDQALGNRVRHADPTVHLLPESNQALAEGDLLQEIITRYTYNDFGQLTHLEDARGNVHTSVYFPENDPDGDGRDLVPERDPTTGGYLAQTVRDAFLGPRRLDPGPPVAVTNRFQRDRVGNLTRFTDGRGNSTTYTYNALDQVVQEEQPKVDPSQPTGYLRRYSYDANNNQVGVDLQNVTTNPTNHLPIVVPSHPFFQHRFSYDLLDQLIERTADATRDPAIPPSPQPERLTTQYRYDPNGNRVRHISPLAASGVEPDNFESFTYDERDQLASVTRGGASPQASTWTYDYDRNGNLARWTDAEDNDATPGPESETTAYDGYDRRRVIVDRAGHEQRFAYDPAGHTVREEFHGPTGTGASTNLLLRLTRFQHDELGRRFQTDRALFLAAGISPGVSTTLRDGPLTPDDGYLTERAEFDALSRRTFRLEDDAAVYAYVYDGASRLVRETLPLADTATPGGPYPTQTTYQYDANRNLTRRVDTHTTPDGTLAPTNQTTLLVYDALDRLVRTTDALGQTQYRDYDSRDNLVATYDARGPLRPDPLGLFPGPINDRGNAARYAYDGSSRLWRQVLELTTTGEGGAPLNLTNRFNPDGLVTLTTEYDANSRVTWRTDDLTNKTSYAYDALDRRVAQTNADGGVRSWQFNRDRQVTALSDENRTVHRFTYDALDRRTRWQLEPEAGRTNAAGLPLLVGTTLQTFRYDGVSRLVHCLDNNDPTDPNDDWAVEARYDSLSRVVEEVQHGRTVSRGYVADRQVTLHYPEASRVLHYGYDAHDQCVSISNFTAVAINLTLLGAHCPPPTLTTFAVAGQSPALTVTQQVNALRLPLQQWELSASTGSVGYAFYNWNRANALTSWGRLAGVGAGTNRFTEQLNQTLDSLGRPTLFYAFLNGPPGVTSSFRRLSFDGAQGVPEVRDQANQLVQQLAHSPTLAPLDPAGHNLYDASPGTGNRTRDAKFIYQWDGLNRLRLVRQRANPDLVVARYSYDAWPAIHNGRRVQKTVAHSGPLDGTTRFYYDGPNAIEETALTPLGEQVTQQYLFGRRADEVLALDRDTDHDGRPDSLHFYLRDHNRNTIQLVSRNGAPEEFYSYDYRGRPAFYEAPGTPTTRSTRHNPYLFTGQRFDPETGLYYYKARYYDPTYGVFLSRDPLGAWHDPDNYGNGVAYANNSPFGRTDSTGLEGEAGVEGCCNGQTYAPATQCCQDGQILSLVKACIRANDDHGWIYTKDLHQGTEHAYGRYMAGYGGQSQSGVVVDYDLKRSEFEELCETVCGFTPTVTPGYGVVWNNCVSYATSEWERIGGVPLAKKGWEWNPTWWVLILPGFWIDSPKTLVESIREHKRQEDQVLGLLALAESLLTD